jgi:hypothetical protein
MDRFYASWKDGMRAKSKKLERLKSFVRFCMEREWLAKDIADELEGNTPSLTIPAFNEGQTLAILQTYGAQLHCAVCTTLRSRYKQGMAKKKPLWRAP